MTAPDLRAAKITAIHGGCDWADASADYVVLPEGLDAEAERVAYRDWLATVYKPQFAGGPTAKRTVEYQTFLQWLLARGARYTKDTELEIVRDGY